MFPTALDNLSTSRPAIGTAKLNTPSHLAHHVVEDTAIQALEAKMGINNSADPTTLDYLVKNPIKLSNRILVGPTGHFLTLKEAVDFFNAEGDVNTEILLDAGDHDVVDTITINNGSFDLQIRGLGSSVTYLRAITGLAGKPMFNVKSNCDFNKMTCSGSTLALYGTLANENCITFNTTTGIYSEITDIFIDTFKIGVADLIGVDFFLFNFGIIHCEIGTIVDYATLAIPTTNIDIETGNYEHCTTGISMKKALRSNFIILNIIFKHLVSPPATAILYNGTTFLPGEICNIFSCTYNNRGTFLSGFDFTRTDGRDKDIEIIGNVGVEDEAPHARIDVVDNAATTTIASANAYQKLLGMNSKTSIIFDVAGSSGHFHITVGAETTGAIAWDANVGTIKAALEALNNITTVTVVTVDARKEWTVEFLTDGEGWVDYPFSYDISAMVGPTAVGTIYSYYTTKFGITNNRLTFQSLHERDVCLWIVGNISVNQTNRNINVGIKKNGVGTIISPFSARTATANIAYPFSLVIYLDEIVSTDYFEVWVTTPNTNDIVRLWDMNLLILTR